MADTGALSAGVQAGIAGEERKFNAFQNALKMIQERNLQEQQYQQKRGLQEQEYGFRKGELEQDRAIKTSAIIANLASKGFLPTTTEEYTPEEFRDFSIEKIASLMPKGGFKPGQGLPKNPDIVKIPNIGMFKVGPMAKLGNVKNILAIKNALEKNKPTAQQIDKMAKDEARNQMGGSMMMGLQLTSPEKKKQYDNLVETLKQKYTKEFGVKGSADFSEVEDMETEIDTGWEDINF